MTMSDTIRQRLPKSSLLGQAVRYFGVALVGLIVDFGTVIAFKQGLGLNYLLAAALGFLAGLIVTYMLSNALVFGAPKTNRYALFATFAVVGLVGLGILSLLMWLFTDGLGLHYLLSKVIATVFVFAWNFFARRALYKEDASQAA